MRWRLIYASIPLLLGLAGFLLLTASPAHAHDCSSPLDCEQTGGYNGIIAVVGGIAAVAAAAAAAAAATPAGEKTDLAIVQVSTDHIEVLPDQPGRVTMTGWHVGEGGRTTRVPMDLRIDVPPGTGLRVAPLSGVGEIVVEISVEEYTDTREFQLQAVGTWEGKSANATVHVVIGGEYGLKLY
jgi:hypothetical protein